MSTLIPGKIYLKWYTGGVWCEKCGPERIKESIAIDIKVLDSLDVS
jgi:hypothetical protein